MSGDSRIQNVLLPYQTIVETAAPSNPAAGQQRIYIDPSDHKLKRIDSSGNIVVIDIAAITALATTFSLTGDISPAQITADQDDYNPTGLSTASVLRLSADAPRNITGLQGGSDGRVLIVMNVGAQNIVLKDDSASSTAANRFALTADITMTPDMSVILLYDSTSSRWRASGGGASGGGTSSPSFFNLLSFTPPPSSGWTWDNQVSSTIDSAAGYEYLFAPRQSAIKLACRYRTPSNAHYQIDVALASDISGGLLGTGGAVDVGVHFGFRDSGGKWVGWMLQLENNNWKLAINKWTTTASFSAAAKTFGPVAGIRDFFKEVKWLRLEYDGTNLNFLSSIDGYHYHQFYTMVSTSWLAAGKPDVGFGGYVNGGEVAVALLSWKENALA
jgi:hypothetical protein